MPVEHVKCVVIGDGGVGKTCLLKTYVENCFPSEYVPTVFDNYTAVLNVDGLTYSVGLWDTSGQTNYGRLRPLAYPGTDVFMLCFAINFKDSYENITLKWLPEIKHHCPTTPIILVGTKLDTRDDTNDKQYITHDKGTTLMKIVGARGYFECSARTQKGVHEVFEGAVRTALEPPPKKKSNGFCSLF